MDVVWAVVSKVSELTVEPIGRQLGYLIYYRSNLNKLKEQLEKLDAKTESLQHAVAEDRRGGREIESNVKKWFDRADKIKADADKFYGEESQANIGCSCKSCPNLWLRDKWSRRAKKMADEVVKVMEDGKFDTLSYTKPPEWTAPSSTSGADTFESRVRTLNKIVEALADPAINMVGVHGLPGVGKTTLATEVASKAREDKLYDTVVMVEVKQKPDNKTIQREMAEMVGLKFEEDSQFIRASRLNERLRQEKKLLVILDDLWERLDLQKIGIPFGEEKKGGKISFLDDEYKGCKILLTSRSEEVLYNQMNCKRKIMVGELSKEEAWGLFKKMAELDDDSPPDLLTIANEVNERCARLPLAIVTVARALRNKSLSAWRDALRQLRQPSLRKVPGLKDVDSSIKLSYDYLEGRDLKSFFLLSAMLSNDALTSDLFKYCIGLGLFEGIYTMEESLDRLQTMMKTLKASCLLLDGSSSDHFKIHDVVRDSALSMAFNEKHPFVKRYEKIHEWPDKGQLENCKYLCFRGCDIDEPPPQLNCPSLELFLFECKHDNLMLPDDIFKGMPLLRVLDLTRFNFSSLPTPITSLENLTSLCLHQCELTDIAMIGVLRNLKVLSLTHSIIQELPDELACLTRLQLLDLSNCRKLEVIPQNTISRLNKLEALYLENSFNRWQDEGSNGKTANAGIAEIQHLANLSSLSMHVRDASILPKGLSLDKLKRYKLLIGDVWKWSCKYETSKTLKLKLKTSIHSEYGLKRLLGSVEAFYLDELLGIKDVVYELDKNGFPYLQHLCIQNNSQIQCIVNSTHEVHIQDVFPNLESLVLANMIHLERFCERQLTEKSFQKLRVIEVESCHKLKSLFSISLVRCFSQLEEIKISSCKIMKQIVDLFSQDEKDTNITSGLVQFCKLRSLTLNNLSTLFSFCFDDTRSYDSTMSYAKLDTSEFLFDDKIVLANLDSLQLSSINCQNIWQDSLSACSWVKSLTNLKIEGCEKLQRIFSTFQAMRLVNLKRLEISKCEKVEEIFFRPEDAKGKGDLNATSAPFSEEVIFPSLETLIFSYMDNLKELWPNQCGHDSFRKLKNVEIFKCGKLETVFPSHMIRSLCHVETVTVSYSGSVETIYDLQGRSTKEEQGKLETNLRNLELRNLDKLEHIWNSGPHSFVNFNHLQSVHVFDCDRIKTIFPAYVAMSDLQHLAIASCDQLEEVVAKEENANGVITFNLSHLQILILLYLPRFKGFYPGMHILECPKLKRLFVAGCSEVALFEQEAKNIPATPLFSVEKAVPYLDYLGLNGKDARKILKGRFREDLFHNIAELILCEIENDEAEFLYGLLHRMPNLKFLILTRGDIRELFPIRTLVEETKQTVNIARIRDLWLVELPRLESICIEGSQLDPVLENLEDLTVLLCPSLEKLVPASASLNCLTLLEVASCDGLKHLFSPSTARSLVHLKEMKIKECEMLQEIVAKVEDENEDEISFSHLESLKLEDLSNLSSFCLGKTNFGFPYLEKVTIKGCPMIKIFSQGQSKCLRLQGVYHGIEDHSSWEGDLNSTIRNFYKE